MTKLERDAKKIANVATKYAGIGSAYLFAIADDGKRQYGVGVDARPFAKSFCEAYAAEVLKLEGGNDG